MSIRVLFKEDIDCIDDIGCFVFSMSQVYVTQDCKLDLLLDQFLYSVVDEIIFITLCGSWDI